MCRARVFGGRNGNAVVILVQVSGRGVGRGIRRRFFLADAWRQNVEVQCARSRTGWSLVS